MKKNMIYLAMIGLSAGMCLSGKGDAAENKEEIAMSKCTKDLADEEMDQEAEKMEDSKKNSGGEKKRGSGSKSHGCGGKNGCEGMGGSNSKQRMKPGQSPSDHSMNYETNRKSAARKVLEGEN